MLKDIICIVMIKRGGNIVIQELVEYFTGQEKVDLARIECRNNMGFSQKFDSVYMDGLRDSINQQLYNSSAGIFNILKHRGLVINPSQYSDEKNITLYDFFVDLLDRHCQYEYYKKLEVEMVHGLVKKSKTYFHHFGHYEVPMYSWNGNNHINCRSNCVLDSPMPLHQKRELENTKKEMARVNMNYSYEIIKGNIEKGDENMKIKKTDELSIEEFKETDKAYDSVFVVFDMDKYEKIAREYGDEIAPKTGIMVYGVRVYGRYLENIIEFYPKAISLRSEGDIAICTIPYYIVDKVFCTYYIEK